MTSPSTYRKNSFISALRIQLRVIHALIMREIITRYGRHNLGFAWLFVEPMIFTLGVVALWYFTRTAHGNSLPIVPFALTGYSTVILWRNVSGRAGNAIEANTGLLYHRNVKVIDVFLARMILEVVGATISLIFLSLFFIFIDMMSMPANFIYMVYSWFLLIWFAMALGLTIGPLLHLSEPLDRLWHAATYLLFPLSGAAFFVHWLPNNFQNFVLYVPMVHFTEMIRHGYYGDLIPTYEDIKYMISWNLCLSFIGLYLVSFITRKIEASS